MNKLNTLYKCKCSFQIINNSRKIYLGEKNVDISLFWWIIYSFPLQGRTQKKQAQSMLQKTHDEAYHTEWLTTYSNFPISKNIPWHW